MRENLIFMHENFAPCMKMTFSCMKIKFSDKTYFHRWEFHAWHIFGKISGKFSSHEIFGSRSSFSCMKFSCHDFFHVWNFLYGFQRKPPTSLKFSACMIEKTPLRKYIYCYGRKSCLNGRLGRFCGETILPWIASIGAVDGFVRTEPLPSCSDITTVIIQRDNSTMHIRVWFRVPFFSKGMLYHLNPWWQ